MKDKLYFLCYLSYEGEAPQKHLGVLSSLDPNWRRIIRRRNAVPRFHVPSFNFQSNHGNKFQERKQYILYTLSQVQNLMAEIFSIIDMQ